MGMSFLALVILLFFLLLLRCSSFHYREKDTRRAPISIDISVHDRGDDGGTTSRIETFTLEPPENAEWAVSAFCAHHEVIDVHCALLRRRVRSLRGPRNLLLFEGDLETVEERESKGSVL